MNLCEEGQFFAGLNNDCKKFLELVKDIVIVERGTSMTLAEATIKTIWLSLIRQNLTAAFLKLSGYEPSQDEATTTKSQFGITRRTQEFPPSLKAYLDVGMCDFRSISNIISGRSLGFYFILQDGTIHGWEHEGKLLPFTGTASGNNKGFAPIDDPTKFNEIQIFFDSLDQFKAFKVIRPNFNASLEFLQATPNGYDLQVLSYVGGVATVRAELRCDEGVEGFLQADFEVVRSHPIGKTISSFTEVGLGVYDISIAIGSAEFASIMLKKDDGATPTPNVTDVSGIATISQ